MNSLLGPSDTGTVGPATPVSFFFDTAYGKSGFSLGSTTPRFPPPAFDAGSFNQFSMASAGGGTAYGSIDGFQLVQPSSVPILSPFGGGMLALGLGALGAMRLRR